MMIAKTSVDISHESIVRNKKEKESKEIFVSL